MLLGCQPLQMRLHAQVPHAPGRGQPDTQLLFQSPALSAPFQLYWHIPHAEHPAALVHIPLSLRGCEFHKKGLDKKTSLCHVFSGVSTGIKLSGKLLQRMLLEVT